MTLAAIGVVAGLAGAFSLTRVMASLLFNVRPDDPTTYLAISFLLIVVAFLACYLPARRAAKLDPLIALSRARRCDRVSRRRTDSPWRGEAFTRPLKGTTKRLFQMNRCNSVRMSTDHLLAGCIRPV